MSDEGLLAYIVQLEKMFAEADAENTRLRAGGCARDQTTTQFCAEAVALQAENARLREALQMAMDDTPGWYDVARAALAGEEKKP